MSSKLQPTQKKSLKLICKNINRYNELSTTFSKKRAPSGYISMHKAHNAKKRNEVSECPAGILSSDDFSKERETIHCDDAICTNNN